jgi:hypothetical protein
VLLNPEIPTADLILLPPGVMPNADEIEPAAATVPSTQLKRAAEDSGDAESAAKKTKVSAAAAPRFVSLLGSSSTSRSASPAPVAAVVAPAAAVRQNGLICLKAVKASTLVQDSAAAALPSSEQATKGKWIPSAAPTSTAAKSRASGQYGAAALSSEGDGSEQDNRSINRLAPNMNFINRLVGDVGSANIRVQRDRQAEIAAALQLSGKFKKASVIAEIQKLADSIGVRVTIEDDYQSSDSDDTPQQQQQQAAAPARRPAVQQRARSQPQSRSASDSDTAVAAPPRRTQQQQQQQQQRRPAAAARPVSAVQQALRDAAAAASVPTAATAARVAPVRRGRGVSNSNSNSDSAAVGAAAEGARRPAVAAAPQSLIFQAALAAALGNKPARR